MQPAPLLASPPPLCLSVSAPSSRAGFLQAPFVPPIQRQGCLLAAVVPASRLHPPSPLRPSLSTCVLPPSQNPQIVCKYSVCLHGAFSTSFVCVCEAAQIIISSSFSAKHIKGGGVEGGGGVIMGRHKGTHASLLFPRGACKQRGFLGRASRRRRRRRQRHNVGGGGSAQVEPSARAACWAHSFKDRLPTRRRGRPCRRRRRRR